MGWIQFESWFLLPQVLPLGRKFPCKELQITQAYYVYLPVLFVCSGIPTHVLINSTHLDPPGTFTKLELVDLEGVPLAEFPISQTPRSRTMFNVSSFIPPDEFFYVKVFGLFWCFYTSDLSFFNAPGCWGQLCSKISHKVLVENILSLLKST